MNSVAKILLIGGHATLMGSIAARLEYEHHCTVVGIFGTPEQAANALAERSADVVLVDSDESGSACFDGLMALRESRPGLRIILISSTIDDSCIDRALKIGVNGFLTRDKVPTTIASVIHEVLAGGVYLPNGLPSRFVLGPGGVQSEDSARVNQENRELEWAPAACCKRKKSSNPDASNGDSDFRR